MIPTIHLKQHYYGQLWKLAAFNISTDNYSEAPNGINKFYYYVVCLQMVLDNSTMNS